MKNLNINGIINNETAQSWINLEFGEVGDDMPSLKWHKYMVAFSINNGQQMEHLVLESPECVEVDDNYVMTIKGRLRRALDVLGDEITLKVKGWYSGNDMSQDREAIAFLLRLKCCLSDNFRAEINRRIDNDMDVIRKETVENMRARNDDKVFHAVIRHYKPSEGKKDGWCLCFGKEQKSPLYVLRSAREEVRIFKTIDAAYRAAEQFGYEIISICN